MDSTLKLEADKLKNIFLERVYSKTCLRKAFNKVSRLPREELLFKHKKVPSDLPSTRVILRHNNQQSEIKIILNRHWPILAEDTVIKQFINEKPAITFRRAASLKDKLVSSELWNGKSDPCWQGGAFPCSGCSYCTYMLGKSHLILPSGESFVLKHLASVTRKG